MSSVALLSIKPVYAREILAGTKTIELRRSAMGLKAGDIVLVYISAPEQRLGFWFRIKTIETLPPEEMWRRYHEHLGIAEVEYRAYFDGASAAVGLHIGELHPLASPVPLAEIQRLVPGFVTPQGLLRLREAQGRYEQLLRRLSSPLPRDAFPQQSFTLGLVPELAQ